jgi:diguanylate cyclase (GGDEF)-like protein/PAS domain S-box-containing protein
MMRRFAQVASFAAALFAACAAIAAAPPAKPAPGIDFASPDSVIAITSGLTPYHGPNSATDHSGWYLVRISNTAVRPSIRVLLADQPPSVGLRFLPASTRPRIVQAASADSGVIVENMHAYGRRAYRVTVPPATASVIAVQLSNMAAPPSVMAWTEPALAAHNRQLAIFITAVWALIGSAALITGGLAITLGHAPARWAALTLLFVLLERLAETGLFDASLATAVGGPYGLQAMLAGLSIVAGVKLADAIVPVSDVWPISPRWFSQGLWAIAIVSVLAYFGLPGMTILTSMLVVVGTVAIAAYLVYRGRHGVQAARVAAPSAAVFAFVALASAVASTLASSDSMVASAAGGFAAVGALLLALAVAAGEGIAVLPFQSVAVMPAMTGPHIEAPLPEQMRSTGNAFADAIGASHQGVFDLDFASDVLTLSAEGAVLLGLSHLLRVRHGDWVSRIHPDDRATYTRAIQDYRTQAGLAFRIEFRARSESGRYPWLELRATMMGTGHADRCLGLIADVTMRKEAEAEVMDRTLRDPLTGLGNRVALMEELEQLGPRFKTTTFALIDIDRFKAIHASLGDRGGDDILKQIADRLSKRFKGAAEVFRVGGDGFAMLFSREQVTPGAIGAQLIEASAEPYLQGDRNIFAPVSIGLATGQDAQDPLDFLKNAELALLQAKRTGGGCARLYSPEMELSAPGDTVVLETDLRQAIQDKQIDLYYQPIVRLNDGVVAGFEALLRWHHPTKGLVAPAEFIAHSEETGTIVALGHFALERAAHDIARWQKFFPVEPPLFVSVNVSRRQLRDDDFGIFLGGLLHNTTVAPGTLKLEITEGAVATDREALAALTRCRDLGAGLAIDDFGTGQSSLSQLKDLPFDTIKVDQSFLRSRNDAGKNQDGEVLLKSIIDLARDLKRSVVVEGVETAEQATWLKSNGCKFGQGFYFSRPLPSAEALRYIAMHFDPSGASGVAGEA